MTFVCRDPCWFAALLVVALFLSSCDTPSRQFNSDGWKAGNPSIRGGMAKDLMARKLLTGKSRADIEALLGKPDYQFSEWYGYKVVTIARCRYIWECRMDVVFDPASNQVKSVAVSD